ncbi:MAG TPA: hypothetical protein PKD05_04970, partial [Candidatus Melainabacteria bacterium]|nr:hypothetical protein [Candidatus Melainabacteria bacterium]
KSHIEGELVEGVHYQIDKATGRLQRTDLGEIRQPYKWPVENERFAPDIERQAEADFCVGKIGEMLSGGTKSQRDIIKDLNQLGKRDIGDLAETLGSEWTSAEGPKSLAEIGKNGPWGAELNERPWTNFPKSLHSVIVEGPAAGGKGVTILDPFEATRYEMSIENFLKAWTRRCVYKK